MKTISINIEDVILKETKEIADKIGLPLNTYVNDAIVYFNRKQKRTLIENILKQESSLVVEESMKTSSKTYKTKS